MARNNSSGEKELSLAQNIIWNSVGSIFYLGCQWLITVLVVVLANGYTDSGLLAFAMTVGNIFAPIALYKIRAFQASDVKDEYTSHEYVGFRLVTILAGGIIAVVYALFVNTGPASIVVMAAYLLFKADETFSDVLYGVEQKAFRMDLIGISQVIRGLLSLGSFAIVLHSGASLTSAILSMAGSCMLVTLFFDIHNARKFDSISPIPDLAAMAALARTCLPAVIASLACAAVVSVSRQYFGIEAGNEALGIYAAVATPAVIVQVIASYVFSPFLGPLAIRWSLKQQSELKRMIGHACMTIGLGAGLAIAALMLVGPWLLVTVYGTSISGYTYLLGTVLVCTTLTALITFLTDTLIVFRDFRAALGSNLTALAVCLCGMAPCIQAWGMMGLNIVIIISYTAGIGIGAWRMARDVGSLA